MKRAVAAVVLALAVLAAACGSSNKASTATPGSTAAPKKITNVVLLTHSSFATSKGILDEFTKQTGYKVKVLQPGDAGVMVNQAILRKDNPVADALYGVDNTFLSRALDAGIFDPYTAHGADTLPSDMRVDPRVTPIDTANVCVIYDKTYFGHDGHPAPPASFDDLIQPPYKNLTVVENASTSSPGLAFLLGTIKFYSARPEDSTYAGPGPFAWQDYWKRLRANGVRVVDDWTQAYQTDFTAGGGSGDRPIVVSYGSDPAADIVFSDPHRDTPNVGVVPSTCFRQTEYAGVLHGAKNTPGAQALVDFLLSRRFQEDMPLQMYVDPIVPDATRPPVFAKWAVVPPSPLTLDAATIGAHRDEWIKEWTDIAVR
jgi:thiamine transport system substrate-binding protein